MHDSRHVTQVTESMEKIRRLNDECLKLMEQMRATSLCGPEWLKMNEHLTQVLADWQKACDEAQS